MGICRRALLACLFSAAALVAGVADPHLPLLVWPAVAAPETVSLDPFEIDLGWAKLRIPHLEASGTTLDKAALMALLDPKGSMGLMERMDKLTAVSITASDVSLESSAGKLSYRQVTFANVVRGRIGKIAATGGALGLDAAVLKAAVDTELGDLRIDNLDLGLLARCLSGPRQDADEPVRTFFDRAEFDGFRIKAGDRFVASVGKWSLADVQLRPLLAATRAFDTLVVQALRREGDPEGMARQLVALVTDIWSSIIVGEAEIRDVAFNAEQNGEPASFKLSRVHLGGVGRGKFDDLAIEGVDLEAPGSKVKLAAYAFRGLDLSKVVGPIMRTALLSEQQRVGTGAPAANLSPALVDAIVDLYDGFTLRSAEIRGFELAGGQGTQAMTVTLGRYAAVGYEHARVGDVAVENLYVATGEGHVSCGELTLRNFNYGPILKLLRTMAAGPGNPSLAAVWHDVVPTLDQFVLARVDLDVPDQKGTGNAGGGKRDIWRLGRLEINAGQFLGSIPTELTASLEHAVFVLPNIGQDVQMQRLNALGIANLDVSMRFDAKWDRAKEELMVNELSIDSPSVGKASVVIELAKLPIEAFTGDLAVAEAAWLAAGVKSADLWIFDVGLLDKELAYEAASSNVSLEQRRRDAATAVATQLSWVLGSSPAADNITKAIEAFVRLPKSLRIAAVAEQGLRIADFAAIKYPNDLLQRLDVHATANE
jgi:hypothetical protein